MPGTQPSTELWAITCYFNPLGYRRRLENYTQFRAHLRLPLVTVELGYGGHFELTADAADILIQIPGRDVLWQKERLLNLALEAVPASCRQILWTDQDVLFAGADWSSQVGPALERFALVRPFDTVDHVAPDWEPTRGATTVQTGGAKPLPRSPLQLADAPETCRGAPLAPQPWGKAWVARRELLDPSPAPI